MILDKDLYFTVNSRGTVTPLVAFLIILNILVLHNYMPLLLPPLLQCHHLGK